MRLTSLNDTALFVPGITFEAGFPFIINGDDLQTDFDIEQDGDFINLEFYIANHWYNYDDWGLPFGDVISWQNKVSPPVGEQSIAYLELEMEGGDMHYWVVKEQPNTLGYSPLIINKKAEFSGYVWDKSGQPIPDVELDYLYGYNPVYPSLPFICTDEEGYFSASGNMYCRKYNVFFYLAGTNLGDSLVSIEPDSANYFEFTLDTLLTGLRDIISLKPVYTIQNVPNPCSSLTTFIIDTRDPGPFGKGVIKIFSGDGIIVDIIPVEITGQKQELCYNPLIKSLASGVYFYHLEIGRQRVSTGKMVIGR